MDEQGLPPAVARAARLEALARYDILETPREALFDDMVKIAAAFCETPVALVTLVDRQRQWFKARVGTELEGTPLEMAVCAHALDGEDLLVIPDLAADPRTAANPIVTGPPHARFYAGAPLRTGDGHALGTICVLDLSPRPGGLTAAQQEGLAALGRQTMALIEMRHRIEDTQAAIDRERRARGSALAAEMRIRAAQEAGRIGTFELDVATGVVTVSAEFCRLYGVAVATEVPADVFERLVEPADRAIASSTMTRRDGSAPLDVEYRIRRANDGTLRWLSRRASFGRDAEGRVERMYGAVHDVTDRRLQNERMAALIALGMRLRNAQSPQAIAEAAAGVLRPMLSATRAGFATVDATSDTFAVDGGAAGGGAASGADAYPLARFGATIAVLRGGKPLVCSDVGAAPVLAADRDIYRAMDVKAQIAVPLLLHGTLVGVLFVQDAAVRHWSTLEVEFAESAADQIHAAVTRVQAEAEQDLLNRELSHRLKNMLTMVQAIAGQTLRHVPDRAPVEAFLQRLLALSNAHDILFRQHWAAAPIRAVAGEAVRLVGQGDAIAAEGPEVMLGAKAALSLSLLIHELATNAMKYGALSVPEGSAALTWRIEGSDETAELVIAWRERGGPPVRPPARRGFGSRLIGMGLVGTGGAATRYEDGGLEADFRTTLHAARQA